MSKMKELFISIQQGLMDGVSIEKQMQRKYRDDENRVTLYKKKLNKKKKNK
jgi:predicted Zn-dependent protease with MMP-like domain